MTQMVYLTATDLAQVSNSFPAPRVRKMHLLSNAAQATGHMRSPILNRVRDLALRCVPSAVKGWVFDQVLRFTVSR